MTDSKRVIYYFEKLQETLALTYIRNLVIIFSRKARKRAQIGKVNLKYLLPLRSRLGNYCKLINCLSNEKNRHDISDIVKTSF